MSVEVFRNNAYIRTPCVSEVSPECEGWEKPGDLMLVVTGTTDWVCPPCAEIEFPEAEASRKQQAEAEAVFDPEFLA